MRTASPDVPVHPAHSPSFCDMKVNRTAASTSMPRDAGALRELQHNARRVASLLKAMSNPARLVILCQLAEGERSVGELERVVGLSQSSISQHLAVLRGEAVVSSRRVRQTVLYSLASKEVVALMTTLYAVFCHEAVAPKAAFTRARGA